MAGAARGVSVHLEGWMLGSSLVQPEHDDSKKLKAMELAELRQLLQGLAQIGAAEGLAQGALDVEAIAIAQAKAALQ